MINEAKITESTATCGCKIEKHLIGDVSIMEFCKNHKQAHEATAKLAELLRAIKSTPPHVRPRDWPIAEWNRMNAAMQGAANTLGISA